MAVIKLGGLINEIRGSAGGTTFRKIGSKATMYNKDMARAGHGHRNGGNLEFLSRLNKTWNLLTDTERAEWRVKGAGYDRTDRFGNLVPYSGRELFYYMISTRVIFGNGSTSISNGSDTINDCDIVNITLKNKSQLSQRFENLSGEIFVLIRLIKSTKTRKLSSFRNNVLLDKLVASSDTTLNIDLTSYPYRDQVQTGDFYTVYYTFCSSSGLRNSPVGIQVEVTA